MANSNYKSDLEQDFILLFENVAQGVIYLNKDGKIEEANPAAIDLLGLSHEQIIGVESIDERWETIKPDFSVFPGNEHPAILANQSRVIYQLRLFCIIITGCINI